ncbi:MAG: putative lipid II flippase FtsW [Clostridiales Family XIII bacterium]|jgi:cell division protein FtsW|nr:putative lipid II flippase FtsW [Clostridiales Family XIII bacterium]
MARKRKHHEGATTEYDESIQAEAVEPAPPKHSWLYRKIQKLRNAKQMDFLLFIVLFAIIAFGVIMVFSSSYYSTIDTVGSAYVYLRSSSLWALFALGVVIVTSFVPYKWYSKSFISVGYMLVAIGLLLALFTPLGETHHGATRWLNLGPITLMPGEIAKPAVIIFVAWYYNKMKKYLGGWITNLFVGAVPIGILALLLLGLIYAQPNLSTAMIIVFVMVAMMFIAGIKFIYLMGASGLGVVGLLTLINMRGSEHQNRMSGYRNPFADAQGEFYQTIQGLLGLGAGGLTGVGLGNSIQKALYLPEAQNDYIFSIIGEEVGFIGILVLMAVYLVLIWRCTLVTIKAPDRFSMLLCAGCTMLLTFQVLMNIAVVTNLIPPTGIGLPFISYGGNSELIFAWCMGMVLNVSRSFGKRPYRRKPKLTVVK